MLLALVVLGTFVFRRDQMTQEEKSSDNWYRSNWFSLDLLSPVHLGVSKKWRPNDDKLRDYAQIHRVAGSVLIPLIVAAITRLIK